MRKKIRQLIRCGNYFGTKLRDDHLPSFSAHAGFFIIVSFFPFFMFLLTMFKYLPITESDLLSLIRNYIPASISAIPIKIVEELFADVSGTFISITLVATLWSASKGFYAIMQGLNSVYGIRETRNVIKLLALSILYTVIFAFMILATLIVLVFGNQILNTLAEYFPRIIHMLELIGLMQLIIPLLILTLFFLCMFRAIPNRPTTFRRELPGAFASSTGWIIFSRIYSIYIDQMGRMSNTYGSLAAIIFFMLWLYACMYIIFLGAELNVFLYEYKVEEKNLEQIICDYEKKTGDHF